MIENGFLKETVCKEVKILNDIVIKITWENFSSLHVDVKCGEYFLAINHLPMLSASAIEDIPFSDIVNEIYNLDLSLPDTVNLHLLFTELNGINNTLKAINDSLFPLSDVLDTIIAGIKNKNKQEEK